ncbi:MAG: type II toxin-antitoxin system RelE/ParE family toxin [Bacteroidales bacterium]|nr:type II toxin-antitoxin system RelE/ParE family toxin [Bacteroidales bacterium]
MRVVWYPEAAKRLRQVVSYIQTEYGSKSCTKFLKEAYRTERLLAGNPCLGPVEPFLADAPVQYRSIVVNRLNKIVYWINGDVIEIVDFWDTRREPNKQAQQTIESLKSEI